MSPVNFAITMRSLAAERGRGSAIAIGVTALVFGGWFAWFAGAKVTVHEAAVARIQVLDAAHAVDTPVAGRVISWNLKLGAEVHAGDVLAELDSDVEARQLDQARASLDATRPEMDAVVRELKAEEDGLRGEQAVIASTLGEGRARQQAESASSRRAAEEARRAAILFDGGAIADLDLIRARSEAERLRASTMALGFDVNRLREEQRVRVNQALSRIEDLRRHMAELEGQEATGTALVALLEKQIDKHTIRAPIDGKIGEVATFNVGTYVKEGDRLGAVVPVGSLRAVADFDPPAALGKIRPGQAARLRLDGFPWTQFGTVPARVTNVGSEPHDGHIRVELELQPEPGSRIPLQHGLPGSVEIDIERMTPASLTLRAAGQALGAPVSSRGGP